MFAKPGKAAISSGEPPKSSNSVLPPSQPVVTYNAIEQDVLARTIWGEARNSGYNGMQAVANVIMNRVKANKARQWGSGVVNVCKFPSQFSCWNVGDPNRNKLLSVTSSDSQFKTALDIAAKALTGKLADLTRGSTFYLTSARYREHQSAGRKTGTYWSFGEQPVASIGGHYFFTNYQVNGVA